MDRTARTHPGVDAACNGIDRQLTGDDLVATGDVGKGQANSDPGGRRSWLGGCGPGATQEWLEYSLLQLALVTSEFGRRGAGRVRHAPAGRPPADEAGGGSREFSCVA